MNLELLDPFGRQVPDRVDSTLQLPKAFSRSSNNSTSSTTTGDNNNNNNEQQDGQQQQQHVVNNNDDNEEEEEEAYICSFNRRGTYLAVGYSTGAVAIYNTLNRSLASIYNCSLKIKQPPKKRKYKKRGAGKPPPTKTKTKTTKNNKAGKKKKKIATSGKGNNKKQQQQSKAAAATAADDDDEDNVIVAAMTTTLPQEQEEQEEELGDNNNINSENDHNNNNNDIDDDDETIVEDDDDYDDDHNDNHVDQQQKAGAVVQEDTTTITTALLLSATTTTSSSSSKKQQQQPKKKKSQKQQQPTTTTTTTKKGGKVVPTTTTKAATTTTTKAADANREKSSSSVVAAEGNSNVNAPNNNNNEDNNDDNSNNNNSQQQYYYGCSSLSWSRRSRMLLAGAAGDTKVQLHDTSHPAGPDDCSKGLFYMASGVTEESLRKDHDNKNRRSEVRNMHSYSQTKNLSFANNPSQRHNVCINETRALQVRTVKKPGDVIPPRDNVDPTSTSTSTNQHHHHHPDNSSMDDNRKMKTKRCASVTFEFPAPVAGSLQVHPRRPNYGLAVLTNGALMVFWISAAVDAFKTKGDDICCTTKLYRNVSCACFDPHGDRVYACCKDGRLVGFDVSALCSVFDERSGGATTLPDCPPQFEVPIGEAVAWHVLVSRNNKFLVLNSSDGAIRLYNVADCWENAASIDKPVHVFQDVVTKVKFASFDLSGDGEYIVGGANGGDNKYELYIWNTSTGALIDKLSGSSTKLYSVAWHPARSFIAVACGDGLVDIWGPRINWTAFAPDFQALPMNVEYVEREDEFDVDEDGRHLAAAHDAHQSSEGNENSLVDVTTIEAVPVFASDSEDEVEVFEFETRVKNLIAAREVTLKPAGANKASSKGNTGDD